MIKPQTIRHALKLGAALALWETLLTGFVVMSDARLPISPDSPQFLFTWDGVAPSFSAQDKASYGKGVYSAMTDEEATKAILDKAASEWNSVYGTYLEFKVDTATGPLKANSTDGINAILVGADSDLSSSGYTVPTASPDAPYYSKIVTDCDIHLGSTGTISIEGFTQTAAHEMGHCVGLGHPHTNYAALMSYARDIRTPELGEDDIAGLLYLYRDPAKYDGEVKNLVAVPCGVVGARGFGSMTWLILLLPMVAAFSQRAKAKEHGASSSVL